MGDENKKTTSENIDLDELYNSQIINLIKKYENTNEMMPLASIKSDLFLASNRNDFNIFIKLITKCSKNISDEDLNYLLSLFSIKETSSKELEEILNMINNEITIRKLRNSYIESGYMDNVLEKNFYNMYLDSKMFNPLISSELETAHEEFIPNNQHIELVVPGGKIIEEIEEPIETVNSDDNIIEKTEEIQENNTKKVKEKELIISRVRTLKENEKEVNKDILKESARIILETAVVGILLSSVLIVSSKVEGQFIRKILLIIKTICTSILSDIAVYGFTNENYFEAWENLIDAIKDKYKISINKKELKNKLASLNLDEINNDLEENKHVK